MTISSIHKTRTIKRFHLSVMRRRQEFKVDYQYQIMQKKTSGIGTNETFGDSEQDLPLIFAE